MSHRYTIGGLDITVTNAMPELSTADFADTRLSVQFVDTADLANLTQPGIRMLTGPGGTRGAIDPASRRGWVAETAARPAEQAWLLRQMTPSFCSALGRLVLHASAVEIAGEVVAFIGESGAGKSTLARHLAVCGYPVASDDLLPVRFSPIPASPVEQQLLPLGALMILERSDSDPATITRNTEADALQALIRNGFGEHGDPEVWATQFDAYHRLATTIPVFDLAIPDGVERLSAAEQALTSLAKRGFSQRTVDGGR